MPLAEYSQTYTWIILDAHYLLLILGKEACTFTPSLWLDLAEWGALFVSSILFS